MSEIRFYHLQQKTLDHALPEILSKALDTERRVVVKASDAEQVQKINDLLWTYRADSFIPHGSAKDGYESEQPVFLTESDDNPNGAEILILTGGATSEKISDFSLCCEMLDGNDADAVSAARDRWKSYKEDGHEITYWQQNAKGGWEKKS